MMLDLYLAHSFIHRRALVSCVHSLPDRTLLREDVQYGTSCNTVRSSTKLAVAGGTVSLMRHGDSLCPDCFTPITHFHLTSDGYKTLE